VGSVAREFGEKFGLQSGLFYKNWGAIGGQRRGNVGYNWQYFMEIIFSNSRNIVFSSIFHGNNFQ
jgi:hypothetical protein